MNNKVDEQFLQDLIESVQKYTKLREELLNSLVLERFVYRSEFNELLREIEVLRDEDDKFFEARDLRLRRLAKELFKEEGYNPNEIHSIRVKDTEGKLFRIPNYVTEANIYFHNDETWVIEFQSILSDSTLIKMFLLKKLLESDYRMRVTRLIAIAMTIPEEVMDQAESFGIEVWNVLKDKQSSIFP